MLFKDIDIFWQAAQAILQGRDPYSIPNLEVFYPLPFYFLFVPLVALPLPVVHVVWTALQAVILVAILRRRVVLVTLAMPVLLTFILGQVDIVMTGLFVILRSGIAGGIALAFLVLKPHLVLLLAPWMLWQWWQHDRRQILLFAIVLGVLVLGAFVVQPDWLIRFLARSGARTRPGISASVWGLLSFLPTPLGLASAVVISIGLVIWAWCKSRFDWVASVGLFISPFIFSYNLLPLLTLVRKPAFLIGFTVLSWIAFGVGAIVLGDGASALPTVLVMGALLWQERHRSVWLPIQ